MRKLFLFTAILLFINRASGQWTDKSGNFGGVSRPYRVYVPLNYNPGNPASLVLTLHGLGDNMNNFSGIGMNYVADTANIIVVVPQAYTDPFVGTAWNSGAGYMGYFPNSGINDVNFLTALIDTVKVNYSINPNRVYCCGFSMGGFMTQRMACEKTHLFSAVASVAGTFGNGLGPCSPGGQIPVAHFHGTLDQTVGYYTNNYGVSADSLVKFWVNHNQCNTTPVHTALPDLFADGYTVDHYRYSQAGNKTVEHFKVNNANHIWMGPVNDISYTLEIWKFFNRHRSLSVGLDDRTSAVSPFVIFPNPANDLLEIRTGNGTEDTELLVRDLNGRILIDRKILTETDNEKVRLDLQEGIYLLEIRSGKQETVIKKLVIRK